MEHKHAIVIDEQGYKVEFVLVEVTGQDGQRVETPLHYTLQPGESLVYNDVEVANGMLKPRRVKEEWQETATPEEITAAQPEPMPPPPPDPRDLALAELTAMVADTQHQTDLALAELVAMVAIGGGIA